MAGANVHNKVKVSSHCLSNSGTICFDIPKWSEWWVYLPTGTRALVLGAYFHTCICLYIRGNKDEGGWF